MQVMAKEDEAIAASLALLHTVDLADDAVNCVCWSKDGTQVSRDTRGGHARRTRLAESTLSRPPPCHAPSP